ncbi:hypothetical protein [Paraburkholderia sp. GAS448]|uniref:hypothetical protein n=1 Tax=Paraburkholderia sp. GAS448 TaxID=3035136 RepID=UPI003D1A420D
MTMLLTASPSLCSASYTGVGNPAHETLWCAEAVDFFRTNPDQFSIYAAAYFGMSRKTRIEVPDRFAKMIPDFDPVAAAYLRMQQLPGDTPKPARQVALSGSDEALSRLAHALYMAVIHPDGTLQSMRLRAVPLSKGLASPTTPLATLIRDLRSIQPLKAVPTKFALLSQHEADATLRDPAKLRSFLQDATGGTTTLKRAIAQTTLTVQTDFTAVLQVSSDAVAAAGPKSTSDELKNAQAVKSAGVAVLSLFDSPGSKQIDSFVTPALSGTSALMDLAQNGFSAIATGNVVTSAVALVKFIQNTPDPAALAQQDILKDLRKIQRSLDIINHRLDVMNGKLDAISTKLDDIVTNQNVNTQEVLTQLAQISDQVTSTQTLQWQAYSASLQQRNDQEFETCRSSFATHSPMVSAAVNDPSNLAYAGCLGTFLSEAVHTSAAGPALSTTIDFNRADLLRLVSQHGDPESALSLIPYMAASAQSPVAVVQVSPDSTITTPPLDPDTWADGVKRYLQIRYWVPELPDKTGALDELANPAERFKTNFAPILARQLPKAAVNRYFGVVGLLNTFLETEAQPLFKARAVKSGNDLVGTTRPAIYHEINVFAPSDALQGQVLSAILQLGLAKEVDTVRGDGAFVIWEYRGPTHTFGWNREWFNGCIVTDISASMSDGSGSMGPISVRYCSPPLQPGVRPPIERFCQHFDGAPPKCQHGLTFQQAMYFDQVFDGGQVFRGMEASAQDTVRARWPAFVSNFRQATDWPAWEASLPRADGFTPTMSGAFFAQQRAKIEAALAAQRAQVASFMAQRVHATDNTAEEEQAKLKFMSLIEEINRSYVAAVGLMILSYGECIPYNTYSDWPSSGTYALTSGTAIQLNLLKGILPSVGSLNAQSFPVLVEVSGTTRCRTFPKSILDGEDWLSGYKQLH